MVIGSDRRRRLLLLTCTGWWLGCGGGGGTAASGGHVADAVTLSAADVTAIVESAARAVDDTRLVIAVTDRAGRVLGIFKKPEAPATTFGNFGVPVGTVDLAIALARTGAFFSNNQAPLSSRTVRFISGIHFPPGIPNTTNAALYGIENTNRGCALNIAFLPGQSVPPATSISGLPCNAFVQDGCGLGIATGKPDLVDSDSAAVNPGGVPVFKDGAVAGGVGVAGVAAPIAEFAAFRGSVPGSEFGPRVAAPGVIFLDGVELPFVAQQSQPVGTTPGSADGTWLSGPFDGGLAPEGWLAGPIASAELSADNVNTIVQKGIEAANHTRAAIRLPLGSTARMVLAVGDLDGNILGLYRMEDSTVFSIDVAVAKARNVVYFSGASRGTDELPGVPIGTAVTNRTINFGSQPLYPPGIDVESAPESGPFFESLYGPDTAQACSQGRQAATTNQNGVVFFAGSVPLYRSGQLVGGLGISGDGVEQDDVVAAAGASGFEAPAALRADQIIVRGVRLPYLKFNRNPEVQ